MKYKETIERANLAMRKGGYQSSAQEEIFNPDPKSTYFMAGKNKLWSVEADRFDRDYVVHEKKEREEKFMRKMENIERHKMEHLNRDNERWQRMDNEVTKEDDKISKLRDSHQAGKKNLSSAAYNPITLEYDPTDSGQKLKQADDMAKYRAQLRSYNIDCKSNSGYNILTGGDRIGVVVKKPDFMPNQ